MKKGVFAAIVLLVLAASGYLYYSQVYLPGQVEPAPAYNTTTVRSGDISVTASGVGSVLPREKVSIGFQTSGVLETLNVKVGDRVEVGAVLAELDDTDAQLKLHQAELAYKSFFSPNSLQGAESDLLTAKATLKDAEDQLEYLISPQVFYWETALADAQLQLEQVKAAAAASAEDIQAAQLAVDKAQSYLLGAQQEYYVSYVWAVFPYAYVDEVTLETVDTYLEPTKDDIALARLKVVSAKLALKDAEDFLQALLASAEGGVDLDVADSGTNLAKLDQARLDLETAQVAVEKTALKSPVSGTVTALEASVGQAVGTSPFLTIETLDQMSLRFFVEENDIQLVKLGSPVVITFEAYPDQPLEGVITYLEPAIQLVDGSPAAVVWADLPEKVDITLLSGMSAEVEVIAGKAKNALLVPVQALRELAPNSYAVFVVQPDASLKLVPVVVGLKDFANAEILSGLKAGDVISTGSVETK